MYAQEGALSVKKAYTGADLSTIIYNMAVSTRQIPDRTSVITREEAIDAGRQFASQVRDRVDPDARIFVFGSAIKGNAHVKSDIDIAVVSKAFDGDYFREAGRVSGIARNVSWDIEVHAIMSIDWLKGDPHVLEIQKWGVEV
jgi:predicted nucleotidyltransferase